MHSQLNYTSTHKATDCLPERMLYMPQFNCFSSSLARWAFYGKSDKFGLDTTPMLLITDTSPVGNKYLSTDSTNTRKALTWTHAINASPKFTLSHRTSGPWKTQIKHLYFIQNIFRCLLKHAGYKTSQLLFHQHIFYGHSMLCQVLKIFEEIFGNCWSRIHFTSWMSFMPCNKMSN